MSVMCLSRYWEPRFGIVGTASLSYISEFVYNLPELMPSSPADSPLQTNPMLVKNTTHVTVSWSPPFLWSGEAISHYNISFIKNMDVETVTHHLMNHTYSDSVVSYSQEITDKLLTCAEVMFVISAVGKSSSSGTLRPYNVSSCEHLYM